MRGISGFRRFVYNYGLDLITASWGFEEIQGGDSKRIDASKKVLSLELGNHRSISTSFPPLRSSLYAKKLSRN